MHELPLRRRHAAQGGVHQASDLARQDSHLSAGNPNAEDTQQWIAVLSDYLHVRPPEQSADTR